MYLLEAKLEATPLARPAEGCAAPRRRRHDTMAAVDARGYPTRRASKRMERRALAARPQPCPICGVVLAGEELLRHAETCRGFSDSEEASDESSSDESFAEPITIWTETSPDPRTPLVVTFINKPRPKPIRMRPPPLRGTPWPASRPLDPTASVTTPPAGEATWSGCAS